MFVCFSMQHNEILMQFGPLLRQCFICNSLKDKRPLIMIYPGMTLQNGCHFDQKLRRYVTLILILCSDAKSCPKSMCLLKRMFMTFLVCVRVLFLDTLADK